MGALGIHRSQVSKGDAGLFRFPLPWPCALWAGVGRKFSTRLFHVWPNSRTYREPSALVSGGRRVALRRDGRTLPRRSAQGRPVRADLLRHRLSRVLSGDRRQRSRVASGAAAGDSGCAMLFPWRALRSEEGAAQASPGVALCPARRDRGGDQARYALDSLAVRTWRRSSGARVPNVLVSDWRPRRLGPRATTQAARTAQMATRYLVWGLHLSRASDDRAGDLVWRPRLPDCVRFSALAGGAHDATRRYISGKVAESTSWVEHVGHVIEI